MKPDTLQIQSRDNVAVSLCSLAAGTVVAVAGRQVRLPSPVPAAHKFALDAIRSGEPVVQFGHPIGTATCDIASGAWVHGHNLCSHAGVSQPYTYECSCPSLPPIEDARTFLGYRRPNGEVGIRNEIWIIPTVGCVNEIAQTLARQVNARALPGNIGGVHALPHPYGCSQLGDDHATTQRLLAALAQHPNAGGVLVVGLGCENNSMASFRRLIPDADSKRYQFLVAQAVDDELAVGRQMLDALIDHAAGYHRERIPVGALRIGLKCGGADRFSALTANPLVGAVSDGLVARGASTILTEAPELFGAEGAFLGRCADRQVFDAAVAMLNRVSAYFERHGQPVLEAPSAGLGDGGATTIEERSLGCLQKAGTAPIVDVLPYGARLRRPGLSFLTAPGNDMVAVTALAAAGAHAVIFTTGRGTPLGGPIPTLKISSTTELATRKPNWNDFDAGERLHGANLEGLAARLLDLVIETASGQPARNELNGFREIAIFKDGLTL